MCLSLYNPNFYQHRMLTFFSLILWFSLVLILLPVQGYCQTPSRCLTVAQAVNQTRANCDLDAASMMCVKIKFHFIKDPSNTAPFPSDQVYSELLAKLNDYLYRGKIKLILDQDCIDKRTINFELNGPRDLDDKLFYGSDENIAYYRSQLGYDENAFHVYSEFAAGGDGMALPGKNITYTSINAVHCMHEVGHMFALLHTHGWNHGLSPQSYWECKNPLDPNDGSGDGIDDTGADPYSQDLEPKDGLPDYYKWINTTTCQQNISASVPDKCGNTSLPWNIPVDNIMSYYPESCKCFFTTGQLCKMREWITLRFPQYITSCAPTNACADIIITSPTKWSNGSKTLCDKQKIILRNNGTLTLDNYILTRVTINPTSPCQNLVKLAHWDGIYLETNKNTIILKNNSLIEYSENGIQALNGGRITLENSKFQNNRKAIQCENDVRLALTNSEINVPKYCNTVQVRLINTGAKIDNTKFINNEGKEVTALKSLNGNISISSNTLFTGFAVAIDKEGGLSGLQNGMQIESSKFDNCDIAVRNLGTGLEMIQNFVDGDLSSMGLCSGNIYANNFRKKVMFQDPQQALKIEENFFYKNPLLLNGSNKLTDLSCNQWHSSNAALEGICSDLKIEWGSSEQSSGNIFLSNSMVMNINAPQNVINWHYAQNPQSIFTYLGKNIGADSKNNKSCHYDIYPKKIEDKIPNHFENAIKMKSGESFENAWVNTNSEKSILENSSESNMSMMQNLEIQSQMIVNSALQNNAAIGFVDDSWKEKLPSKTKEINKIYEWFFSNELDRILTWCHKNKNHEFVKDIESLRLFIIHIGKIKSEQKDQYNLSPDDKNYITSLAKKSHGDYSSIIRAYLNLYCDIRIDPSVEQRQNTDSKLNHEDFEITINPNPILDHFLISDKTGITKMMDLEVYSIDGKLVDVRTIKLNEMIRLEKELHTGLYMMKLTSKDKSISNTSMIMVK